MLRIPVIIILIFGIISCSFAQDSIKKAKPVKPAVINKPYKYHTSKYYVPGTDTSAKHRLQRTAPLRHDGLRHDSIAPAVLLLDKSLNGQYQYLLTKVYRYQQPLISAFWKVASDTLNLSRSRLRAAQNRLIAQGKTIDSLKADVTNKDQNLTAESTRVNGITVLGVTMSKATYNLLTWGLVLLFGAIALFVILRSGSYGREAKYRTQLYTELEEEFKAYKAKANDKEKKLARELQTERNKLDELLGRG